MAEYRVYYIIVTLCSINLCVVFTLFVNFFLKSVNIVSDLHIVLSLPVEFVFCGSFAGLKLDYYPYIGLEF